MTQRTAPAAQALFQSRPLSSHPSNRSQVGHLPEPHFRARGLMTKWCKSRKLRRRPQGGPVNALLKLTDSRGAASRVRPPQSA